MPSVSLHSAEDFRSPIDARLQEHREHTAVEQFAERHDRDALPVGAALYRELLPAQSPSPGEQYAFEVNLDACSGCKGCVTACHSLNGLEETEIWRSVGLLQGMRAGEAWQQTVTTACHHCVDPACLNGCPVLAYEKDPVTGIVRHLDDQCMGCSYCVMKCPYEVPKYSKRLGIVRKCDLCAHRLAVGEAPACVQGCPNQAIRITLVKSQAIQAQYRGRAAKAAPYASAADFAKTDVRTLGRGRNAFLPDSPAPGITLPTTRFVSRRGVPIDAVAADQGVARLDHAHTPLVVMLLLTQASAGMFLAGWAARWAHFGVPTGLLNDVAFGLLGAGLTASVLHLGRPWRAWRAFLGWRRSWLSREILAFNGFAALAGTLAVAPLVAPQIVERLLWLTPLGGLTAVLVSAMVYVDTRRAAWSAGRTLGQFLGTTLVLGASLAAMVGSWHPAGAAFAWSAARVAWVARGAVFGWRWWLFRSARRDAESAVHLNARAVAQLLPWAPPLQTALFLVSTALGGLGLLKVHAAGAVWLTLSAGATLGLEGVARFLFFAASSPKRMPGGIP